MAKEAREIFQQEIVVSNNKAQDKSTNWVIMESCDHDIHEDVSDSSLRSIDSSDQEENSMDSIASSFSSDLAEDANSSSSSFSSSSKSSSSASSFSPPNSTPLSNGPLYELSDLMVHLPLRRGLSKYYQGKSQSFTSLAKAKSLEDLPKKVAPFRRRIMKPCKSFNGSFDGHKLHCPKAIISKKSTRGSSFLSSQVGNFRPSVTIQKNF